MKMLIPLPIYTMHVRSYSYCATSCAETPSLDSLVTMEILFMAAMFEGHHAMSFLWQLGTVAWVDA